MEGPRIVIEHLEEGLTPWLILEYRHASLIAGSNRIIFTNVPGKYRRLLAQYGTVMEESVVELVRRKVFPPDKTIILDPRAEKALEYGELSSASYVVVGGILGDHPPRGRTYQYITSKLPGCPARNIGDKQFSIDGTVYYVMYMLRNRGVQGLEFVDGVTIETEYGSVYLPYRYPALGGRPLLAPGLEYYLKHRMLPREIAEEILNAGDREK
ncbi:hypothetical protein ACSU1N_01335 [Thermogladius sp. 4427co]|uniref:hypothetical protein n=1 Tax=Thermogladius sp. 4427co TaxID=3450718 RepID=UPI003F792DD2